MSDEARRTRYDIYADILEIISRRGTCSLTRVSYGANMPVDRAKRELTFLLQRGFVKEAVAGRIKQYSITRWGVGYLETYRQMRKYLAALEEK